jgi:tetratricopeptide (TPR) repeat protein
MDVGDIVVLRYEETFSVLKILHIDPHPDGDTFHCLNYWPLRHEPAENEIESLEVECYHSPINGESIRRAGRVLCNRPVSEEELSGFLEYLKQTDFARYAEETGQDVREIVERAKRHYERGNELSDSKMFKEAIDEYTLAFEEFPMFYEAVDNRGIAYMGIGDLRAAIWDFETSIELNPGSHVAYLSKGQCYLELGELDEVETTLLEGARRCPDQQDAFSRLLELSRSKRDQANAAVGGGGTDHARQKGRAVKKSWWRFWRGE